VHFHRDSTITTAINGNVICNMSSIKMAETLNAHFTVITVKIIAAEWCFGIFSELHDDLRCKLSACMRYRYVDKHGTLGRIMLHDNYGIIAPIDALCSSHMPIIIEFYGCIHSTVTKKGKQYRYIWSTCTSQMFNTTVASRSNTWNVTTNMWEFRVSTNPA